MKLMTAVIRPQKLDDVCDALERLGVTGLTVIEARGYGRQRRRAEASGHDPLKSVLRLKIEVAVEDAVADRVEETIAAAAQTGHPGDGKIFVLDLEDIMRIRTRERGSAALS